MNCMHIYCCICSPVFDLAHCLQHTAWRRGTCSCEGAIPLPSTLSSLSTRPIVLLLFTKPRLIHPHASAFFEPAPSATVHPLFPVLCNFSSLGEDLFRCLFVLRKPLLLNSYNRVKALGSVGCFPVLNCVSAGVCSMCRSSMRWIMTAGLLDGSKRLISGAIRVSMEAVLMHSRRCTCRNSGTHD